MVQKGSKRRVKKAEVVQPYRKLKRDMQFAVGETYHIFNRGAHKANIFEDEADYQRFTMLLYLANRTGSFEIRELQERYGRRMYGHVFEYEMVNKDIVDVLAYTLMPNHFHLIVREKRQGGISQYMKKISTAYAMYFNSKYGHTGALFQGTFKSTHVEDDYYLRWLFSYVHLNPISLCEPDWKSKGIQDLAKVRSFLRQYLYSTYLDFRVGHRPESKILSTEYIPDFLKKQQDELTEFSKFPEVKPPGKIGENFTRKFMNVG